MVKQLSAGKLTVGSKVERSTDWSEVAVRGEVKEDLRDEVIVAWEDGTASPVLKDNVRREAPKERGQGDW
jgi:hypothetical protein